jgi:hypothetical protein
MRTDGLTVRHFAKAKGKKKKKASVGKLDEHALELVDFPKLQTQIAGIHDHLVEQFKGLRAGKPNPGPHLIL